MSKVILILFVAVFCLAMFDYAEAKSTSLDTVSLSASSLLGQIINLIKSLDKGSTAKVLAQVLIKILELLINSGVLG